MASDIRGLECAEGGKVIFRKWFEKEFLCRKFMVWRIVIRQEKDTHSLKANRNRQMHVLPSANRLCEVHVTYFCGDVYFCWVRYIAAYWKSSNTFCLFPKQPAWCHVSPYSLERKTEGIEVKIRKTRRSYPGKKIPIELHKETYIKFGPLFAFAQGDKCHAGRGINPCYIVFKQWELYL